MLSLWQVKVTRDTDLSEIHIPLCSSQNDMPKTETPFLITGTELNCMFNARFMKQLIGKWQCFS